MVATKYIYSIQTDFPNHKVDSTTLTTEIGLSAITVALDHIDTAGDNCDIWFKAALSGGEETMLNGVVAVHQGIAPSPGISLVQLSSPKMTDNKPFFTPDMFPAGTIAVFADCADNATTGVRWAGDRFQVSANSEGDTVFEAQFIDLLYLVGGDMVRKNGTIGDYAKHKIYCPATAGTENVGAGDFDKFQVATSCNMYVYVSTGDGDWDLNLTEKLNANVNFTKAVPVPCVPGTGWFDYNPTTDTLVVNPDHAGSYNLFDFDVYLPPHLPVLGLLGDGTRDLRPFAASPKALLPHWIHEVTVHHGTGTHQLDVTWTLIVGRYPF